MESCCKSLGVSGHIVADHSNTQSSIQGLTQHYPFLIPEITRCCILHIFAAQCTHKYGHNRSKLSMEDLSCSTDMYASWCRGTALAGTSASAITPGGHHRHAFSAVSAGNYLLRLLALIEAAIDLAGDV